MRGFRMIRVALPYGRASDTKGESTDSPFNFLVRMRGLEPPRCHHHRLLRPARLPVPPHPRTEPDLTNAFVGCQATSLSIDDIRAITPMCAPLTSLGTIRIVPAPPPGIIVVAVTVRVSVAIHAAIPRSRIRNLIILISITPIYPDVGLLRNSKYCGIDLRVHGWTATVPAPIARIVAVHELGALLIKIGPSAPAISPSLRISRYR